MVEQLALVLVAVEPTELVRQIVDTILRLESIAASDVPCADARRMFQIGHALVRTCERTLGVPRIDAERYASA
ncbi:MAG TPA: hypothetical protein VF334_16175 [Polyangia bacterium]